MRLKLTGLLMAGIICLPIAGQADTQTTQTSQTTHRAHSKNKKKTLPPPLPSGTQGPVPQVPLDAIPAVPPQVTYESGLLTIVAPNSTLGDILRSVRKYTSADIEIPANATERVATSLGPAPAREVMAELLNGSRFNYILLGSPADSNALVRVVLVAKTPDTPTPAASNTVPGAQAVNAGEAPEADAAEENSAEDAADQAAAEEQSPPPDQPGVKTPQQLLQEMQQRQLLIQQQQQQANQPGANPPGMPAPHQPQPPQQ
ncbi:MAG: hypothetical protein WBV69_23750 [Candidatus Sulfotelmatobacter sp.]